MKRATSNSHPVGGDRRVARGAADVLPDLLDGVRQLQDRDAGGPDATPALLPPTLENYRDIFSRADYLVICMEQYRDLVRGDCAHAGACGPGGVRHGVLSDQADARHAAVDVVDQDAAGGGRADADLSDRARHRPAGLAHRADHHLHAEQPADRRLDAVHLLPRDAKGDHRGRAASTAPACGRIVHVLLPLGLPGIASTGAAVDHPVLERGVLEPEPVRARRGTADRLHRVVLGARGSVLGQALRRVDARDRRRSCCSAGSASASWCAD